MATKGERNKKKNQKQEKKKKKKTKKEKKRLVQIILASTQRIGLLPFKMIRFGGPATAQTPGLWKEKRKKTSDCPQHL
jgi:hypothetical protein